MSGEGGQTPLLFVRGWSFDAEEFCGRLGRGLSVRVWVQPLSVTYHIVKNMATSATVIAATITIAAHNQTRILSVRVLQVEQFTTTVWVGVVSNVPRPLSSALGRACVYTCSYFQVPFEP